MALEGGPPALPETCADAALTDALPALGSGALKPDDEPDDPDEPEEPEEPEEPASGGAPSLPLAGGVRPWLNQFCQSAGDDGRPDVSALDEPAELLDER